MASSYCVRTAVGGAAVDGDHMPSQYTCASERKHIGSICEGEATVVKGAGPINLKHFTEGINELHSVVRLWIVRGRYHEPDGRTAFRLRSQCREEPNTVHYRFESIRPAATFEISAPCGSEAVHQGCLRRHEE